MSEKSYLDVYKEKNLQKDLQKLLDFEGKLWRDKSRELKIRCHGTNSKFFHISTITRRRRIEINKIMNKDHVWVKGKEQIGNMVVEHFKDLFALSNLELKVVDLNIMNKVITEEDNKILTRDVTFEEIHEVMFTWTHTKPLGWTTSTPSSIKSFGALLSRIPRILLVDLWSGQYPQRA